MSDGGGGGHLLSTHSFIHIHSLTHSLTHSPTHSLTHFSYCDARLYGVDPYGFGYHNFTPNGCSLAHQHFLNQIVASKTAARNSGNQKLSRSLIMLQHDQYGESVASVARFIDALAPLGVQFVRVDECYNLGPGLAFKQQPVNYPVQEQWTTIVRYNGFGQPCCFVSGLGGAQISINARNLEVGKRYRCVFQEGGE